METKRDEAVPDDTYMPSKGQTNYTFIDFITHADQMQCLPYENEPHKSEHQSELTKKGPIKVRCLPNRGNGSLQIVNSLKEVVKLLAPHGNSSKRTDEGNCALVLFYSKTCIHSAAVAHHFNAVSTFFPDIRMGAIDALRFHGLNTDFGIVGLPTVMLFHQGKLIFFINIVKMMKKSFFQVVQWLSLITPFRTIQNTLASLRNTLESRQTIPN